MSKKYGDFVVYERNGVEINALVAISHDVYTPATQEAPAYSTEHLTIAYLDPESSAASSGEQVRNSLKTQFDVRPMVEGLAIGWKDVVDASVKIPVAAIKTVDEPEPVPEPEPEPPAILS